MTSQVRGSVLRLYDTVADPSLWPSVLDEVADAVNARGCLVFELTGVDDHERLHATLASSRYDLSLMQRYLTRYFKAEATDQRIFETHSLQDDRIELVDDSVIAQSADELRQRPNVRRLTRFGILHRAAGLLNKDNRMIGRFSVQLGTDRGRLTADERRYMGEILPHMAKAMDLGRAAAQLRTEHQSLLAAMDRLVIGICILDPKGNVVVQNDEFRRQVDAFPVMRIASDGALRFMRADDEKRFAALKGDAFNHGRFGARPRKEAVSAGADTFLCIEVAPLDRCAEIGTRTFGGFIVYSTDTSLPVHCNTRPIQAAFGLTDTELALVEAIGEGLTNAQIAERRGRAVATIDTQVKSILAKTQCATRTQFVRLMMGFGVDYIAPAAKTPPE